MKSLTEHFSKFINEGNEQLKRLAKSMYFNTVKSEDARKNFERAIETLTVFDKRQNGYYCTYCKRFSKNRQMPEGQDERVIYHSPGAFAGNPDAIWIVKPHYDGCRGWD